MCSHTWPDSATTYTAAGPCPVPVLLPPRPGITSVSSIPAARNPLPTSPSHRKPIRYVVTRVAGRFEAQGQQRHGPLLSSPRELAEPPSAVVTQCDIAASHPQRSNKPSRRRRTSAKHLQSGPLQNLSQTFLPDHPSPHSLLRVGTRSDLALGPEWQSGRRPAVSRGWNSGPCILPHAFGNPRGK